MEPARARTERGFTGAYLPVIGSQMGEPLQSGFAPTDMSTIVSTHATVAEAYAALDRIGEKLHQDEAPEGTLEIYVVDDGRQPVPRPGAQ